MDIIFCTFSLVIVIPHIVSSEYVTTDMKHEDLKLDEVFDHLLEVESEVTQLLKSKLVKTFSS